MARKRLKGIRKSWQGPLPPAASVDVRLLTEDGNLLERSEGRRVYEVIEQRLLDLPKEFLLIVDLTRVGRFGYSALKEVFAALGLVKKVAPEGKHLVFRVDMNNHDLVEQIRMAAKDGGYVVPVVDPTGSLRVLGKLTKAERDTLMTVEESGGITSTELKQRLNIMVVAASNRLRALHSRGLVRRDERSIPGSGGREFVYKPLIQPSRKVARK